MCNIGTKVVIVAEGPTVACPIGLSYVCRQSQEY